MPDGELRLHEQTIPIPGSLSPEARGFLTAMIARAGSPADPEADAARAVAMLGPAAAGFAGTFETFELDQGALLHRAVPEGAHPARAYFDIHGGAFIAGGGEMCRMLAKIRALDHGVTVWSVDYRLAPDHPYPAALDDCLAAYRHVLGLHKPADLVVAGSSAGGNLAAALMLRAAAQGLPLPAGLLLNTPALCMLGKGDSRATNRQLDVSLPDSGGGGPASYVGTADPADPCLSPLEGEIPPGWPPTMLTSGTRDLLLSDSVRMHRKLREAGVDARLFVTEAGVHIGFMGQAPEDRFIMAEGKKFCAEAWG